MAILAPKPPLLDALPTGHAVLEASAGTGKTYALEHLVIDLLLGQGMKLEQILVVTFTEKAALELKTRVRELLEHLRGLEATPEDVDPAHAWTLDEAARQRLEAALLAFDGASIHTIHGFCLRVLQESAFECGRLFDQESAIGSVLFERAFKEALRTRFMQEEKDAALLRRALADGWTMERLRALLENASSERAPMEPDPAKAIADLKGLDAALLRDSGRIRNAFKATGVHANSINAILRVMEALSNALEPGDPEAFWGTFQHQAEKLEKQIARFGDPSLGPELNALGQQLQVMLRHAPSLVSTLVTRFLPMVRECLRVLKQQEGLYDFNDMIEGLREALEGPSGNALRERLRKRFRVALIDEFQDTDVAQWEIFRTLFLEGPQRLVLVGDPKQAIYGFRGGDLPTYFRARREVLESQAPVMLDQNFRSTEALLRSVNRILSQDFFTGANRYDQPVRCGKPQLRLQNAEGLELPPLRILEPEASGRTAQVLKRWARLLAEEISAFIAGAPRLGDRTLDFGDVFILTSKTSEGRIVAEDLREAGVPFAFFKQEGLFQTPEAGWILDLLKTIEEPRNASRRARALLTPFFGIPMEALEGNAELPEEHPVLLRIQAWSVLARTRRYPELFEKILNESGILRRMLLLHAGERESTNLRHLLELLLETALADHRGFPELVRRFGRWVEERELPEGENGNLQRLEGERRAVQILTMHKSKGLEAPVVALFGGISGSRSGYLHRFTEDGERRIFLGDPLAAVKTLVDQERSEEDQRLLYVALTRAQGRLILPRFRGEGGSSFQKETGDPKGRLGLLNRRLRDLVGDPDLDIAGSGMILQRAGTLEDARWEPHPLLPAREPDYGALRALARPLDITSFTRLQHQLESEDPEPSVQTAVLPSGALPAGAKTGVLLHGLLEKVALTNLEGINGAAWCALPETARWLEEELRLHGLPGAWASRAGQLVHRALSTPLPLMDGKGVALRELDPAKVLRELDFLSPFPGAPDFLRGSLDVLFEHRERAWVLDWKSNLLPEYELPNLERCIHEHYELQVRIYTLAALAFLGIQDEAAYEARFGGVLYVFLRGLPEAGIWSRRPSWSQVLIWQRELAALREVHHA